MTVHVVERRKTIPVALPDWLPDSARFYLRHVEGGQSLRALARDCGVHASTVLRQVRRYENRRDDPLIDGALTDLAARALNLCTGPEESHPMTAPIRAERFLTDEDTIAREARRILRRLCESGAVLAIAPDMEKAAVLKTLPDGRSHRTAVVERRVAQAFALRDWIACRKPGRVAAYEVTATGRAALKRLLAEDQAARSPGFAEAQTPFGDQHRIWGEKPVEEDGNPRRLRYNLAESPVAALGRRTDRNGEPFLTQDLILAAERLREDFELAQMGPRIAQNWDRFLTAGDRGGYNPAAGGIGEGPSGARERVAAALRDLGPGLGDMVLRCCCFLEGLEAAERRMGWSARSGKIVLRIALQRLKAHYETSGRSQPLIG